MCISLCADYINATHFDNFIFLWPQYYQQVDYNGTNFQKGGGIIK